jgi:hypothetical protein
LGKSTSFNCFALSKFRQGKPREPSIPINSPLGNLSTQILFWHVLPLSNVGRASQGNQEFPITHEWLCCENFASHIFLSTGAQWEPIPKGITNWRGLGETLPFTQSPQIIFHPNPLAWWSTQKWGVLLWYLVIIQDRIGLVNKLLGIF